MLDVGEAEEAAQLRVVAGLGGDGEVLVGMGLVGRVCGGGAGRRNYFFVSGACRQAEQDCCEKDGGGECGVRG